MNPLEVIKKVTCTGSTNAKQAILKANWTPDLSDILRVTYDPFMTFRVQKLDFPEQYSPVQPDVSRDIVVLANLLAMHGQTPTAARRMIHDLMTRCTEEYALIVARIFRKDLKAGVTATSINKVSPGLVADFKVQLAHPMEKLMPDGEVVDRWDKVVYPCCVEEKYDGMRIIAVCDGETVKFFSREGHEYTTLDYLAAEVLALRPGTKFVLDGEAIGIVYNPECKVAKKAFDAGFHWEFTQGLSMCKSGNQGKGNPYPVAKMKEHIGYIVWDIVDYDYFVSKGKHGHDLPLTKRKLELAGMFERLSFTPKNVIRAKNGIAFNQADLRAHLASVLARGGEGSMVKNLFDSYEFTRSNAVLKLKEFQTADIRVIDAVEGAADTKYVGMLGNLVVSDSGITSEVGSGFDDDDRVELWLRHLRGELVGTVHEIKYFEITPDKSLRLPVWMCERPDKDECSWN